MTQASSSPRAEVLSICVLFAALVGAVLDSEAGRRHDDNLAMATQTMSDRAVADDRAERWQQHCKRLAERARSLASRPEVEVEPLVRAGLVMFSDCGIPVGNGHIPRALSPEERRGWLLRIAATIERSTHDPARLDPMYRWLCQDSARWAELLTSSPADRDRYVVHWFAVNADNMCTRTPIDMEKLAQCAADRDVACVVDLAARFQLGLRYDW
jgi:hypothetical protein